MKLNQYKVEKLPDEVYYFPNYINEKEEENLIKNIYSTSEAKWTQLSKRRLQNWGGVPHKKGMLAENIPHWLSKHCTNLKEQGIFEDTLPNHVLVNEYKPGQGIMPHQDGPLYFPTVAIISLSGNCLIDFYLPMKEESEDKYDVIEEFKNGCYGKNEENLKGCRDGCENIKSVGYEEVDENINCDQIFSSCVHSDRFTRECTDDKGEDIGSCVDGSNLPQRNVANPSNNTPKNISMEDRRVGSLYLERRSLLVFRADVFSKCLHGIRECEKDEIDDKVLNVTDRKDKIIERKNTRVSLTIRVVPKTLKASKLFGKLKNR